MSAAKPASSAPKPSGEAPAWAVRYAQEIARWIELRESGPQRLPSYTVALLLQLPAANWLNCSVICSNETGGRTIATSDGTNWRRVSDGHVVS